jgi:chloride channel protein, CIC family
MAGNSRLRLSLLGQSLVQLLVFHSTGKWFLLSALVGIVAGLGGIAFQIIDQTVFRYGLELFAGYSPAEAAGESRLFAKSDVVLNPLGLLIVLAVGGLASGFLVYTVAPEAEGHGTDAAIEAFHHKRGFIRPIVPIIKLLASAVTIGTGGSGGREGPIAQIGAGFGSYLATLFRLSARDRRILLAVGIAAGVGSIFRAPLAGALFAAEILYRESDLETDVVVPAAVASTVGYSVYSYWLPAQARFLPLFGKELQYSVASLAELFPMTLLALVLVAVAVLYIKAFYGIHRVFKRIRLPPMVRPMLGAVLTGIVGLGLYYITGGDQRALAVLGTGYGTLQIALSQPETMGFTLLIGIALLKILTTSLTIGSGGSGGVFGPSMVIGGCTGAAVGTFFHYLWPELVPQPAIFAIVGMAGFFAGAAHAPISTIIMVVELTGDYSLLIPTMWVSILCFALCQHWSLYDKQLPSRLDSPAHRGDFLVDILEGFAVKDVSWKQRATVAEHMRLKDIVRFVAETRQHYFPVVDAGNRFVGIFSTDDVRGYLYNEAIWELANARDVMTSRVISVSPEDDLNTTMKRFTERNLDELPVLAANDSSQLLGMLRRRDVISFYNEKLHALQTEANDDGVD